MTDRQKLYVKNNLNRMSVGEMAANQFLSPSEVKEYMKEAGLQSRWQRRTQEINERRDNPVPVRRGCYDPKDFNKLFGY